MHVQADNCTPPGRASSQNLAHILVNGGDVERGSDYFSSFSLCFKGGD